MNAKNFVTRFLITCLCISVLLFHSCKPDIKEGMAIVTLAPKGTQVNTITGEGWRFVEGASIVLVNPNKPTDVKKITSDFFSACSPDLSWDGKSMLFAGQKKQGDPWQIWKMELNSGKSIQITDTVGNFTDPVLLPGERMVYSGNCSVNECNALYVCNADGSSSQQITFHPHTNFATTVMNDGRLLFLTRQMKPVQGNTLMMVLRPDGTKADLFYRGPKGTTLSSKARESFDGHIYFIENDSTGNGKIVSVKYNRPLHSRETISIDTTGSFNAVYPLANGDLLVSYASASDKPFELYSYHVKEKKLAQKILSVDGYQTIDVMLITEKARPRKLPSEVDRGVKTGLLLCQDINFNGFDIPNANSRKATKIEVIGIDSSLGIVDVEKDGSIYLKILAGIPFRIRTMDANNHEINPGTPWLWLMPNERRGFVGLRDDDEMAPFNREALAVKKDPIIIPVVVTHIHEKEVELE